MKNFLFSFRSKNKNKHKRFIQNPSKKFSLKKKKREKNS